MSSSSLLTTWSFQRVCYRTVYFPVFSSLVFPVQVLFSNMDQLCFVEQFSEIKSTIQFKLPVHKLKFAFLNLFYVLQNFTPRTRDINRQYVYHLITKILTESSCYPLLFCYLLLNAQHFSFLHLRESRASAVTEIFRDLFQPIHLSPQE